jgi:hypothetical protein
LTDNSPLDSDVIANAYMIRLRTSLVLQQPVGVWTWELVGEPVVIAVEQVSAGPAAAGKDSLGSGKGMYELYPGRTNPINGLRGTGNDGDYEPPPDRRWGPP